jgi:hypothetical protein
MPLSCGLKRSMPCADLKSMDSSISLKELCTVFGERLFSVDSMQLSDKRQRMSPLYVIKETKCCHPATAALEAALALDDFDVSPIEFGVGSSLALFPLNEYAPED